MEANQPDKYDRAFFWQQINGLNVRTNRLDHEWKAQYERSNELLKRIEALEAARVEDMERIGELLGRVESMHLRLTEAGRVVTELKKQLAERNGKAEAV